MPFKSKAQWRKFFAMANRGEMPESKAKEWAEETKKPFKQLPEHKKEKSEKKSSWPKMARDLGYYAAFEEAGIDPRMSE